MSGDAYEREYMAGSGALLHRQKVRLPPRVLAVSVALPFGLSVIGAIATAIAGAPWLAAGATLLGGALMSVLMAGILIVFASGRIAVSEGELHIQIGPAGPRVAIADIASCEVAPSGTRKWGLGAQGLLDGTMIYRMMGDNARAVRITRRGGGPIVIVCPEPDAVVRAIEEARARRGAAPKTRVEVPVESDAEDPPRAIEPRRAARD